MFKKGKSDWNLNFLLTKAVWFLLVYILHYWFPVCLEHIIFLLNANLLFPVVECRRPEISNGKIVSSYQPSYTYGDTVMFECYHGNILQGKNVIKCEANNTWNPAPPICVPSKHLFVMPSPGAPLDHGSRTQ